MNSSDPDNLTGIDSCVYYSSNGEQIVDVKAYRDSGTITIHVPVRTVSEANWTGPLKAKMKRKREQRTVFAMLVRPQAAFMRFNDASQSATPGLALPVVGFRCTVKLTRHAKGRTLLDDDNLRTAMKHCRDGVADGLGKDDSAKSGITWEYHQLHGQKNYGVTVEIRWGRAMTTLNHFRKE